MEAITCSENDLIQCTDSKFECQGSQRLGLPNLLVSFYVLRQVTIYLGCQSMLFLIDDAYWHPADK